MFLESHKHLNFDLLNFSTFGFCILGWVAVESSTESVVSSEGGDSVNTNTTNNSINRKNKKEKLEMELSHIMQQIQNNLISLLLLDNHEKW